jgi:hypothetical protein
LLSTVARGDCRVGAVSCDWGIKSTRSLGWRDCLLSLGIGNDPPAKNPKVLQWMRRQQDTFGRLARFWFSSLPTCGKGLSKRVAQSERVIVPPGRPFGRWKHRRRLGRSLALPIASDQRSLWNWPGQSKDGGRRGAIETTKSPWPVTLWAHSPDHTESRLYRGERADSARRIGHPAARPPERVERRKLRVEERACCARRVFDNTRSQGPPWERANARLLPRCSIESRRR